jgi:hypothetical protein
MSDNNAQSTGGEAGLTAAQRRELQLQHEELIGLIEGSRQITAQLQRQAVHENTEQVNRIPERSQSPPSPRTVPAVEVRLATQERLRERVESIAARLERTRNYLHLLSLYAVSTPGAREGLLEYRVNFVLRQQNQVQELRDALRELEASHALNNLSQRVAHTIAQAQATQRSVSTMYANLTEQQTLQLEASLLQQTQADHAAQMGLWVPTSLAREIAQEFLVTHAIRTQEARLGDSRAENESNVLQGQFFGLADRILGQETRGQYAERQRRAELQAEAQGLINEQAANWVVVPPAAENDSRTEQPSEAPSGRLRPTTPEEEEVFEDAEEFTIIERDSQALQARLAENERIFQRARDAYTDIMTSGRAHQEIFPSSQMVPAESTPGDRRAEIQERIDSARLNRNRTRYLLQTLRDNTNAGATSHFRSVQVLEETEQMQDAEFRAALQEMAIEARDTFHRIRPARYTANVPPPNTTMEPQAEDAQAIGLNGVHTNGSSHFQQMAARLEREREGEARLMPAPLRTRRTGTEPLSDRLERLSRDSTSSEDIPGPQPRQTHHSRRPTISYPSYHFRRDGTRGRSLRGARDGAVYDDPQGNRSGLFSNSIDSMFMHGAIQGADENRSRSPSVFADNPTFDEASAHLNRLNEQTTSASSSQSFSNFRNASLFAGTSTNESRYHPPVRDSRLPRPFFRAPDFAAVPSIPEEPSSFGRQTIGNNRLPPMNLEERMTMAGREAYWNRVNNEGPLGRMMQEQALQAAAETPSVAAESQNRVRPQPHPADEWLIARLQNHGTNYAARVAQNPELFPPSYARNRHPNLGFRLPSSPPTTEPALPSFFSGPPFREDGSDVRDPFDEDGNDLRIQDPFSDSHENEDEEDAYPERYALSDEEDHADEENIPLPPMSAPMPDREDDGFPSR